MQTGNLPLRGIRVLDLSRLLAGNMLTVQLADFGAEVIKVEAPEGDTLRGWRNDDQPFWWNIYGRNKKSVCLDLKNPEQVSKLLALVPTAQALVESFRPGVLESFGLSPDRLHEANPKLVIVRISGWGQDGPYAHRPGFGTLVEALSGFAERNGFPDKPPALPGLGLADMIAGLTGAAATLTALREVEVHSGRGQVVDVSLLEPMLAILGPDPAIYRRTGRLPKRSGNRSEVSAPRNAYVCGDGQWLVMSGSTQRMAERIVTAIGRPELARDSRFDSNAARLANSDALDEIIGSFVSARTLKENLAHFAQFEVTAGPIYNVAQLVNDPHVVQRQCLVEFHDERLGSIPMHNVFPRMSRTPGTIRSTGPALGEHQELLFPTAPAKRDDTHGRGKAGQALHPQAINSRSR